MNKIKIGVSACLLGQKVRYDGKDKFADLEKYFDPKYFELLSICPEVEMGMSVPRPSIQMRIIDSCTKLVQVNNHSLDFTNQLKCWFNENEKRLTQIQAYIVKSKSPSCGYRTTPHYNKDNYELESGLFVELLINKNKEIPIIDDKAVKDESQLKRFMSNLS